MTTTYLDFEKPIADLEAKIEELSLLSSTEDAFETEIAGLRRKASQMRQKTYAALDPWMKTQVARHPQRPHFVDYCGGLISEFTPLAGDRSFGEDEAIVAGFGRFRGEAVCVIGQEKGDSTETRIRHNFGMPKPEGYRKAQRAMKLAERLGLSAATTTRTVRPLIEAGLIEEQPPAEVGGPGRPTRLLAVVPNSATVAGIKLTADRLYAVLIDPAGAVLARDSQPLTRTDAESATALIAPPEPGQDP